MPRAATTTAIFLSPFYKQMQFRGLEANFFFKFAFCRLFIAFTIIYMSGRRRPPKGKVLPLNKKKFAISLN